VASVALALLMTGCSADSGEAIDPTPTPTTATATPTKTPDAKAQREAARKAPTTAKVTCTSKGARLSSRTIKAQRSGVSLTVSATSGNAAALRYTTTPDSNGAQTAGEVPVGGRTKTLLFPIPPEPTTMTCVDAAGDQVGDTATLTIYDPGNYFRAVDVEGVLDCRPDTPADGPTTPARSTSGDALARLADQVAGSGKGTVKPGPGYVGAPGVVGLIFVDGQGEGTGIAELQNNGAWIARLTATC
jgi:hypothetical protein